MDAEEGPSTPTHDQSKQRPTQGDGRSSQAFRQPNQNFPGSNAMFDPMMAMNMGLMNPIQFQLMMQQAGMSRSGQQQQPHQQQQRPANHPSESQPPPSGYVCYKCGQAGHWIYYCPNVPKGQYVPRHTNALSSSIAPPPPLSEADTIPEELVCTVCKDLFREPSISLCCGKSFCNECITKALNKDQQCPHCAKDAASIQVVPNKTLRKIVDAFLDERRANKEMIKHKQQQQQQQRQQQEQQQERFDSSNPTDWTDPSQSNEADRDTTPDDPSRSSNRHMHQKNKQQFDSTDSPREDGNSERKHNTTGMDPMGSEFNNLPPMQPFMANPAMFMGGGNGAMAPPFGLPDMSWMFGGNGTAGGRGAFPPVNGMPTMPPPLFFGSNGGAPIHYPGGFSNKPRTTGGRSTNTQQQKQQPSDRRLIDSDTFDPSSSHNNNNTESKTTTTTTAATSDSRSSHRHPYDSSRKGSSSTADDTSRSRHRSPSSRSSHHHHPQRESRKRSRTRSRSPRHSSSRRRHSSTTSHRKSRRTSRSPAPRRQADDGHDIADYGESNHDDDDDDDENDDHHHRRYRNSRHRSRSRSSRRRRHGSSSRYRSSSRRRHSDDRHRKSDRYRDSSRDRSNRDDKK